MGAAHYSIVVIWQKYFKSTSKYFKSTSSLPKYVQSTSDIFEVTWKYDICTYVIIAKIKQVVLQEFWWKLYRTKE